MPVLQKPGATRFALALASIFRAFGAAASAPLRQITYTAVKRSHSDSQQRQHSAGVPEEHAICLFEFFLTAVR